MGALLIVIGTIAGLCVSKNNTGVVNVCLTAICIVSYAMASYLEIYGEC